MGGLIHLLPARIFSAKIVTVAMLAVAALLVGCGSETAKIAFVSEVDGDAEIFVIDPKTGISEPLTDNRSQDSSPVWSPDGKDLAYVSDESGDLEINVVDRKGKVINRLTNIPGDDSSPLWSPDGKSLAFVSNQDGNAEIYLMAVDGGKPVRITAKPPDDSMGDWSPDGEWLAFGRGGSDDERGLWLRNPDGVNLVHLTEEADSGPIWSPNGKHIIFIRVFEGNTDIYLASKLKDGTWQDDVQLTRLTQHEEDDLAPAWSPNGDTIAFVSFRDGNGEIYIMDSDGSKQLRLTTNEADDLDPVWSPSGDRMAFVSHLYGPGEIFVMDGDGENQRRLTTNDAEDHSPDW
jgi:Tol biopolymer transport system component